MNVNIVKTVPFSFTIKKKGTINVIVNIERTLNMVNINFAPDLIELCNFDISSIFTTTHIGAPNEGLFNLYKIEVLFPFFDNLTLDRSFYYNSNGNTTNITKVQNLSYDLKFTGRTIKPTEQIYIRTSPVSGVDQDDPTKDNQEDDELYLSNLYIVISGMFKFIKYN